MNYDGPVQPTHAGPAPSMWYLYFVPCIFTVTASFDCCMFYYFLLKVIIKLSICWCMLSHPEHGKPRIIWKNTTNGLIFWSWCNFWLGLFIVLSFIVFLCVLWFIYLFIWSFLSLVVILFEQFLCFLCAFHHFSWVSWPRPLTPVPNLISHSCSPLPISPSLYNHSVSLDQV